MYAVTSAPLFLIRARWIIIIGRMVVRQIAVVSTVILQLHFNDLPFLDVDRLLYLTKSLSTTYEPEGRPENEKCPAMSVCVRQNPGGR